MMRERCSSQISHFFSFHERMLSKTRSTRRFLRAHLLVLGQRVYSLVASNKIGFTHWWFVIAAMAAAMFIFIAANLEYFASVIISACFLPIFIVLLKKSVKEGSARLRASKTSVKMDTPPVDKKSVPKKLNKKTTTRKRRNRGYQKLHNQENMDVQTEGQSKNDASEDSDKHRGRNKKNRNQSPTKPFSEISSNQNKTVKIYAPLSLYVSLGFDSMELYNRLLPYTLFRDQLRENGFPLLSSTNGKAYFGNQFRHPKLETPNDRLCCRCGKMFKISDEGLYESETTCLYHKGKRLSINGISNAGPYSCCGNAIVSDGCMTSKQHVSAYAPLDNVEFVKTREKRQNPSYSIYALDCEMCYTNQGLEVTRISIVGTDGLTVYDSYVLPENPVVDYNTTYSGITANHLKDVKTTLADVQAFLLKLLTASTILVGHGLENDLKALHLIHETIIDTSIVFRHPHGQQHFKRSLKSLASIILKKDIQQGPSGHDSVEDARTCIELMLHKVQRDSHIYAQSQQMLIPLALPPTPQWSRRQFSINPVMVPYSMGYWVPPVGSSCDLY